jgi:hypothetical protein
MRVRVKVGTGPITWTILNDHTLSKCGMYAFLSCFAPDFPIWSEHFISLAFFLDSLFQNEVYSLLERERDILYGTTESISAGSGA